MKNNKINMEIDDIYKTKTACFYYITFIILVIIAYIIIKIFFNKASNFKVFENQKINKLYQYLINSNLIKLILIFGLIILFVIWIKKFKKYTHEHRYIDIHEVKGQFSSLYDTIKRCENKDELMNKGMRIFNNFYGQWIHIHEIPQYKNSDFLQKRKIKNEMFDKYLNEIVELKKECKQ